MIASGLVPLRQVYFHTTSKHSITLNDFQILTSGSPPPRSYSGKVYLLRNSMRRLTQTWALVLFLYSNFIITFLNRFPLFVFARQNLFAMQRNVGSIKCFQTFLLRILLGYDIYPSNTVPAWFLACNNLELN